MSDQAMQSVPTATAKATYIRIARFRLCLT